jgi:Co/Zn/Cd efflux system component
VRAAHDLYVWSIAQDLHVATAHLETLPGADAGTVLTVLIAASGRSDASALATATLQLEGDPCGQGNTATGWATHEEE